VANRVISLRIHPSLLSEVDKLAGNLKITRSSVIERMISRFLEQDRLTQNARLKEVSRG
jgi:metal-responsive CopG/Arc/MetJ family transcriptional regulator